MNPRTNAPSVPNDLTYVKGVGPKRSAVLSEIGIDGIEDLFYYFPRGYLDRSNIVRMADVRKYVGKEEPITVIGEVFRQEARRAKKTRRLMFFLTLKDESGYLTCVWFEGFQFYKEAFENGEVLAVSAVPSLDKLGRPQFVHPQFDRLKGVEEDEPDWGKMFNTGAIIPKYRSSAELARVGLDSRGFRRIIKNALSKHLHVVAESLSPKILKSDDLVPLAQAISTIHFPESAGALQQSQRRLKFDELFFLQLMLAIRRRNLVENGTGIRIKTKSELARTLVDALHFELTRAQKRVIKEIAADLNSGKAMNRLLQGDVGSGKTIVALLTALMAIESGYQVAFMAPTEVLAEQHYRTIANLLQPISVNIRLLIGGQKKRLREDILQDIRAGSAHLVVGTHALIEANVAFANLGVAIVDEQHRFGVVQRAALRQKGINPHVLVMTATPIPRTLAMTVYGDLEVSVIDEMPANRKPIRTALRTEQQKQKVFDFVRDEVRQGRQAYIVFPLIEESEKVDLKAATNEFEQLQSNVFSEFRLSLLHGRMKSEEKDDVMHRFKEGEIQILVATTVIEVGIDVPNASVMIIENAERFGLSQLHQLRGRVGRGADQSYCILMSNAEYFTRSIKRLDLEERQEEIHNAKLRLDTMVATTDGFKIADVDLKLRGPGEFFGTRQSGLPSLRLANLIDDAPLVASARKAAFEIIDGDPQLRASEHEPIRRHFEIHYRALLEFGRVS